MKKSIKLHTNTRHVWTDKKELRGDTIVLKYLWHANNNFSTLARKNPNENEE